MADDGGFSLSDIEIPDKRKLLEGAVMPLGLAPAVLSRWRALLNKGLSSGAVSSLPEETQLGVRAAAVPFGAGRQQLEDFAQTPSGAKGLDKARSVYKYEPIGRGLDEITGNEPGTTGTAMAMGLAQEAPVGLALAPAGAGSAMVRGVAKPIAQVASTAGRGALPVLERMALAGAREAPVGATIGAGMGGLQSEPGRELEGMAGGAAVGGAGSFLAGAGGQGMSELRRAGAMAGQRAVNAKMASAPSGAMSGPRGMSPDAEASLLKEQFSAAKNLSDWGNEAVGPKGRLPLKGKDIGALDDAEQLMSARSLVSKGEPANPETLRFMDDYNRKVEENLRSLNRRNNPPELSAGEFEEQVPGMETRQFDMGPVLEKTEVSKTLPDPLAATWGKQQYMQRHLAKAASGGPEKWVGLHRAKALSAQEWLRKNAAGGSE